ncbi:MAG: hypothetical protein ABIQ79_01370 [Nitrospiraceae bacterium]
MGKVRWSGYIVVTWKGDHSPQHVHVYRDGVLIGKWALDSRKPMMEKATRRVRLLLDQLESGGAL